MEGTLGEAADDELHFGYSIRVRTDGKSVDIKLHSFEHHCTNRDVINALRLLADELQTQAESEEALEI